MHASGATRSPGAQTRRRAAQDSRCPRCPGKTPRSSPTGESKQVASFAELLIDCEEDWIRAVLVGMLREGDRK